MSKTVKFIRKVHLWLGLTSGIVVFIIALTGAIYAFESEIREATEPFRHVVPQTGKMLPPSLLREEALSVYPDYHLHSLAYGGSDDAAMAVFYNFEPDFYYTAVYLNPYNGEVLKAKNFEEDLLWLNLQGHYYLWLPAEIGQPIVAYSTLVFFVMLVTGIFLWWPRNKAARKIRFSFKWKETTKWRRKNYDLHAILGFYAWIFGILFAVTGLVWGFSWFGYGVYKLAGGEKSPIYVEPSSPSYSDEDSSDVFTNMNLLWENLEEAYPNVAHIDLHFPEDDSTSIYVNIKYDEGTYYKTDFLFFDRNTLEQIPTTHLYGEYANADGADKLIRMNYDIHVGAILGLPGKVLAFIASLTIASLPVTGVLMYIGRKRKKVKKRKA